MGTGACLSCTAAVISGPDARQSKALSSVVTEAWDTTTNKQQQTIFRDARCLFINYQQRMNVLWKLTVTLWCCSARIVRTEQFITQ